MPRTLTDEVIEWNRRQFYRAINDERWSDAGRHRDNIEKLEKQR
jgi:hypothetical protein